LDIKISKELKDKLIALKNEKGINYSVFTSNAITEKFERLNNPNKTFRETLDNTEILTELRELKKSIDLQMTKLYRVQEAKLSQDTNGYRKTIENIIIKQLESKLYNGKGKNIIPKSTKSIFERLEKDGHNFLLEEVKKVLMNSELLKYIKNGKLEGWILREAEVNGK